VIISIGIRRELSSQVVIRLVFRVLEIVFPVRRRLPDINYRAWDTFSSCKIRDFPVHESGMAVRSRVLDDRSAEFAERCIRGPEGAEDRGRGWVDAVFSH
jgi:hypothetical protein